MAASDDHEELRAFNQPNICTYFCIVLYNLHSQSDDKLSFVLVCDSWKCKSLHIFCMNAAEDGAEANFAAARPAGLVF